jgi:hypothetical protein
LIGKVIAAAALKNRQKLILMLDIVIKINMDQAQIATSSLIVALWYPHFEIHFAFNNRFEK